VSATDITVTSLASHSYFIFLPYLCASQKMFDMKKLIFAVIAACLPVDCGSATEDAGTEPLLKTLNRILDWLLLSSAYSRPGVKGRKIFGDVVLRTVWRTGQMTPHDYIWRRSNNRRCKTSRRKILASLPLPDKKSWTSSLVNRPI
jgi:hypothetical protein